MAKTIKSKNTAKKVNYSVSGKIDGQDVVLDVQTGCKTFGSFLYTETGDLRGKCMNCAKNSGDVTQACFMKAEQSGNIDIDYAVEKKTRKTSGKKGPEVKFDGEWFGIKKNSSMYEFALYLLMNGPTKMKKVKEDIRRSHYKTAERYPGIFQQNSNKEWFVAI